MGIDLKVMASHFRERRGELLPTATLKFERDAKLFSQFASVAGPLPRRVESGGLRRRRADLQGHRCGGFPAHLLHGARPDRNERRRGAVESGGVGLPSGAPGGHADRSVLVLAALVSDVANVEPPGANFVVAPAAQDDQVHRVVVPARNVFLQVVHFENAAVGVGVPRDGPTARAIGVLVPPIHLTLYFNWDGPVTRRFVTATIRLPKSYGRARGVIPRQDRLGA